MNTRPTRPSQASMGFNSNPIHGGIPRCRIWGKALPFLNTCVPTEEKGAPEGPPTNPTPESGPQVSPFALAWNKERVATLPQLEAGHAAFPPLSGPGHLRLHAHTGRRGRRLLSSRGQRLRRRTEGSESIRGCSRAHRLLHGGAAKRTWPRRPATPAAPGPKAVAESLGAAEWRKRRPRMRSVAQRRPALRAPSCGFPVSLAGPR